MSGRRPIPSAGRRAGKDRGACRRAPRPAGGPQRRARMRSSSHRRRRDPQPRHPAAAAGLNRCTRSPRLRARTAVDGTIAIPPGPRRGPEPTPQAGRIDADWPTARRRRLLRKRSHRQSAGHVNDAPTWTPDRCGRGTDRHPLRKGGAAGQGRTDCPAPVGRGGPPKGTMGRTRRQRPRDTTGLFATPFGPALKKPVSAGGSNGARVVNGERGDAGRPVLSRRRHRAAAHRRPPAGRHAATPCRRRSRPRSSLPAGFPAHS